MAKLAPYNKYVQAVETAEKNPLQGVILMEELLREYPSDSRVLHAAGLTYLNVEDYEKAVRVLEGAAKREREYGSEVQKALAQAYSGLGMAAHTYRALSRAGLADQPWQEFLGEGVPAGAKLADLLEFEDARHHLLTWDQNSAAALRKMQAFSRKFPDYVPALNVMTTGFFVQGDFARGQEALEQALTRDPRNIHALLNLARIERLTGGVQAVRALLPRVQAARTADEEGHKVIDGELALANYHALSGDAAALKATLEAWEARQLQETAGPDAEDLDYPPGMELLLGRLDALEEHPDAPTLLPSQLLPPSWLERWRGTPEKRVTDVLRQDLARIPGWLEGIEEQLLHEPGKQAGALAGLLLIAGKNEPLTDGVTQQERVQRFLALLGRPELANLPGRLSVAQTLQVMELLPAGFSMLDAQGQEIKTLSLKLRTGTDPSPLDRASQRDFEKAFNVMKRGRFTEGVKLLTPIAARYPDFPSVLFNLAYAEEQSGDPALAEQARQRLHDLRRSHPHYLYAAGNLAMTALKSGDLEGAREQLRFPDGLTDIHVEEYAYFMAVQGVLALHERNMEGFMNIRGNVLSLVGEDSMPFTLMTQELQRVFTGLLDDEHGELARLMSGE